MMVDRYPYDKVPKRNSGMRSKMHQKKQLQQGGDEGAEEPKAGCLFLSCSHV